MMEVRSDIGGDGYHLRIGRHRGGVFRRKASFEAVSDWDKGVAELPPLTAAIIDELDYAKKLSRIDSQSVLLEFASAAGIQNSDAALLGLPPPFPYQLDIQSRGTLGSANFQVRYSVTQGGVRVGGTISEGIFSQGEQTFRIAGLLFSLLYRIDRLNAEIGPAGKMEQFAALRLLLPEEIDSSTVYADDYLLRIRIAHVTAISLKPSVVDGNVSFDPVPMRRLDPEDHEAGAELAITPLASEKFGLEFRRQSDVNSTYAIESGQYLYIDPSVRTALRVVKQKQSASLEERMAFLMSPAKTFTDAYRQTGVEEPEIPLGDTIFFETAEYSDRITGIGEWIAPQLGYLESGQNSWLPERFSVVLAGKLITGEPDDVPDWIEQVKVAIATKAAEVSIGGVDVPTNSPGLLATLQRLRPAEVQPTDVKARKVDETPKRRIHILQTKSNFDSSEFKRQMKARQLGDVSLPPMKAKLKSHQEEGVSWLTSSYVTGWPGVLLADDMGLGKTLQSLSFLMILLRERVVRRGRPALVVAPTSLLRNWQDEHAKFAFDEGLGKPLVAFGSQLRGLRLGKTNIDGLMLLDAAQIANANWVLTTFETIRDYHMSFAQIPFSVAVLDEIQKAKNPATRINAALKTLNVDFVISMTGTPVENSISDLWAITDITAPGYFSSLREFMKTYGKAQPAEARQSALEKLSAELLQKSEVDGRVVPPYALRRMKEDVAKDLPTKHQGRMIRAYMPEVQAQRYADVSAATQAGKIKILRALHDFRSISLHPVDPDAVEGGLMRGDEYIKMSARLDQAFSKLEGIAQKNEKVIIFVNSRRMQTVLSRLIKQKFGCPKPEYIRGDTIPGQRQEIVNRFSALSGFAALILSPRAAGVGLNIVAANHVVHLDRWWNPAVEDQCTDRAYRIGAIKDVHVYTVGAIHPVLEENSYDVILDGLLESRREVSRRIFTSSEISAGDFADILNAAGGRRKSEDVLTEIDRSGYLGLEEFVRDCLLVEGLDANLTKRSGDGGADIVVKDELGQIIYLVQCKHTSEVETPMDGGLLVDAQRVRDNWRAPGAVVVGISNARKFAPRVVDGFKKIGGRLIAREQLTHLRLG
ncbi:SNF2-related protein [Bradyrhizobium sp. F1.13.3]|uniref:SNF2-related protein n=1 Tax=Bradyrhizobium sp. F1.13.3 TaxID=3156351 RepID=UPI00339B2483